MGRRSSAWMLPRPSMGVPRASTTRPRNPSPTGIPAVLRVRRTMLPALTSSLPPKRMQLRLSGRRSWTMPFTPRLKIRISPYWAWVRPPTVAISPSTVSTSPISSGDAAGAHSSTA